MSTADRKTLQDRMRERYAVHYTVLGDTEPQDGEPDSIALEKPSTPTTDDSAPKRPPKGSDDIDTTPGATW